MIDLVPLTLVSLPAPMPEREEADCGGAAFALMALIALLFWAGVVFGASVQTLIGRTP